MVEDGIKPMLSKYGSCKIPMLLITSKNDHVVDPATSDELAAQWGGPVERILLDRSFHVASGFPMRVDGATPVCFASDLPVFSLLLILLSTSRTGHPRQACSTPRCAQVPLCKPVYAQPGSSAAPLMAPPRMEPLLMDPALSEAYAAARQALNA